MIVHLTLSATTPKDLTNASVWSHSKKVKTVYAMSAHQATLRTAVMTPFVLEIDALVRMVTVVTEKNARTSMNAQRQSTPAEKAGALTQKVLSHAIVLTAIDQLTSPKNV